MAGITDQEHDQVNHRVVSMWSEAGIQFRSNLIMEVGGRIELHAHSFDHVALCTHGRFECEITAPNGAKDIIVVASKDFGVGQCRISIPKWYEHAFTLLEMRGQPGEILCMFPEGA